MKLCVAYTFLRQAPTPSAKYFFTPRQKNERKKTETSAGDKKIHNFGSRQDIQTLETAKSM